MEIANNVEMTWKTEHFDTKIAFLHEEYKYEKAVYIKDIEHSEGNYKHWQTIGLPNLILYGIPSRK